jgi:HK97 family phage prohead protease
MSKTKDVERLFTTLWPSIKPIETRSVNGKPTRTVGGYAAVFGARSHELPQGFREIVEPSFFNRSASLGWPGVVARYEHDPKMLLGAAASGTLRPSIDRYGLDYAVDLPESRSDVYESIERGDITGSSFAFVAHEDDWKYESGGATRHLISGKLLDVAPTSAPAYGAATVSFRSLAALVDAPLGEVESLVAAGELRSLLVRSDRQVAAPATVPPTPLQVAQRNYPEPQESALDLRRKIHAEAGKIYAAGRDALELAQRRSDAWRQRISWDTPEPTPGERQLDLHRRRNKLNETRSGVAVADDEWDGRPTWR